MLFPSFPKKILHMLLLHFLKQIKEITRFIKMILYLVKGKANPAAGCGGP
jgi:hypothetical protein